MAVKIKKSPIPTLKKHPEWPSIELRIKQGHCTLKPYLLSLLQMKETDNFKKDVSWLLGRIDACEYEKIKKLV